MQSASHLDEEKFLGLSGFVNRIINFFFSFLSCECLSLLINSSVDVLLVFVYILDEVLMECKSL